MTSQLNNTIYQPLYYSDKFKIVVSNHTVYAYQQTIYDEIFDKFDSIIKYDIEFTKPKNMIKLCEELHFTKLAKYKYIPNIPEYLKKIVNENIDNLGNLRKFVRDFEFETTWDFWDIVKYCKRNNIKINVNENILKIPIDYRETLINLLIEIVMYERDKDINENEIDKNIQKENKCINDENKEKYILNKNISNLILNSEYDDLLNNNNIQKIMLYLINKFKLNESFNTYKFDYCEACNKFKFGQPKYPIFYKYNFNTVSDIMFVNVMNKDKIINEFRNYNSEFKTFQIFENLKEFIYVSVADDYTKYLITYSDKTQPIYKYNYDVVYSPNTQFSLINAKRFIYSLNEKYYLGSNEIRYCKNVVTNINGEIDESYNKIEKQVQTKHGIVIKYIPKELKYKKYDEKYTYNKYLSDLIVNESTLFKTYLNEYSENELYEFDFKSMLKNYETFKKYTKDSNSIVILIHHLICFQNIEQSNKSNDSFKESLKNKENYNLFKDMIYDLYILQLEYIIEIINVCSLNKMSVVNKYNKE